MFDLNRAISDWRQGMLVSGVEAVEALDELESHLRDAFEHLVQSGLEHQEAFKLAVEQLGRTTDLAVEFQKVEPSLWLPTKVATASLLVALAGLSLWLSGRVRSGGMELLLACHVLAITIGYTSTMVVGGLGICYVCERWARGFSMGRTRSLFRTAIIFTGFSAVLTMAGVVLGAVWAKEHLGRYWGWDVKEIGGLAVLSWLALELAVPQRKVGTRATMMLSIGGNVVVALAWFGANLLASGPKSYGAISYLLDSFVAVNLIVCLIGLLPAGTLSQRAR